jgi:hypothetical protein
MGCGGWFFACAGFFLPIALNTAATTTRRAAPRYTTNFMLPWSTPRGSPWLCLSAAGPVGSALKWFSAMAIIPSWSA